jgi:hypothetical protein
MGKSWATFPMVLVATIVFIFQALALTLLTQPAGARAFGLISTVALGFLYTLVQQSSFDDWKEANWNPDHEEETYRPNRLGLLFLVSAVCLAIEVGIAILVLMARGQW